MFDPDEFGRVQVKFCDDLVCQFLHQIGNEPAHFKTHVGDHDGLDFGVRLKNAEAALQLPGTKHLTRHLAVVNLIDGFCHGLKV